MNFGFYDIFQVLGALAFFIFGMKMMSDGIQKANGLKLRNILRNITKNRFLGIFTGFITTALVQSSSATTVMTVSFVNAGLLTLMESAGVMMGANIGTTITGWIISVFGLEINLSAYSLPLFALALPLYFGSSLKLKYWGEFVFGFAILFLGLDFLREALPALADAPGRLQFLQEFSSYGIWSRILFVMVGAAITIIVQSSTAAMAVTLTLCYQGYLPLEVGAAMILGENIGTTITAEVAALVGNVNARRSARIHSLFNIIGVSWMVILMPFFLQLLTDFVENSMGMFEGYISIQGEKTYENKVTTYTLAAFHTTFNLLNTLLMVPAVSWLVKAATFTVRDLDDSSGPEHKLKFIGGGIRTAELAIIELKKETAHFGEIVSRMNEFTKTLTNSLDRKEQKKYLKKIKKYEKIADNMEMEITQYVTSLNTQEITPYSSRRLRSMINACNDLERMSDVYYQVSKTIESKIEERVYFTPEQRNNVNQLFDQLDEALQEMLINLDKDDYTEVNIEPATRIEKEINKLHKTFRKENLTKLGEEDYNVRSAMVYNNVFSALEKVGNHIYSVTEALAEEV